MKLTIKTKFLLLGVIMVTASVTGGLLNYEDFKSFEAQTNKMLSIDNVRLNQMQADMMHDAIRADTQAMADAIEKKDAAGAKKISSDMSEHFANIDEVLTSFVKLELPEELKKQVSEVSEQFVEYKKLSAEVAASTTPEGLHAATAKFMDQFRKLEKSQENYEETSKKWNESLQKDQKDAVAGMEKQLAIIAIAAGVLALFVPTYVIAGIFRPQSQMLSVMAELAKGNMNVNIPHLQRKDEMGDMAKAIQVFKQNMIETENLKRDQDRQKAAAEQEKRQSMNDLADKFEASVKGIVSGVAAAATELSHTAESMVRTVSETSQMAQEAATGAAHTTANVQSVASAAEEMTASVREISSQLQNSNTMVLDSVKRVESADSQAASLIAATNKVKEVVALISNIAGQINLLALNATIESARAGEAGKGFAVVASEVKNLANQTNKSVQDVEAVIEEMNVASDGIIKSLKSIKDSVQNISGASSTIAAAVEEQSATTNEISRNMQSAAQGAQTISGNLDSVSRSTSHVESSSGQVLSASQELSRQAEQLSSEVEGFLAGIRAG